MPGPPYARPYGPPAQPQPRVNYAQSNPAAGQQEFAEDLADDHFMTREPVHEGASKSNITPRDGSGFVWFVAIAVIAVVGFGRITDGLGMSLWSPDAPIVSSLTWEDPSNVDFIDDSDWLYATQDLRQETRYQEIVDAQLDQPEYGIDELRVLTEALESYDFSPLIYVLERHSEQNGYDTQIEDQGLALVLESGVLDAFPDYDLVADFVEDQGWYQGWYEEGIELLREGDFETGFDEHEVAALVGSQILDPTNPMTGYIDGYVGVYGDSVTGLTLMEPGLLTSLDGDEAWNRVTSTIVWTTLDYHGYL